jgi:predicted MFS family arabinose efflux permease
MTIHTIPVLLERGYSAVFAAFAVGLIGISQIPGRAVFALIGGRLPHELTVSAVFVLIAAGIALIVGFDATAPVLTGLVVLGMGNGMATLARATAIADLYGGASYGTINSIAAAATMAARAAGPVAAAVDAAAVGYSALLWTLAVVAGIAVLLAYQAERDAAR